LPFTFNVTPSTLYSYLPAFKQYAKDIRVVHFIGQAKPWKWNRSSDGSISQKYLSLTSNMASEQTIQLITDWWNVFDEFQLFDLLHGMVLDRDWSKVFLY
jgi:lipopolysaccharide biosynthesis glycosyltransferase